MRVLLFRVWLGITLMAFCNALINGGCVHLVGPGSELPPFETRVLFLLGDAVILLGPLAWLLLHLLHKPVITSTLTPASSPSPEPFPELAKPAPASTETIESVELLPLPAVAHPSAPPREEAGG